MKRFLLLASALSIVGTIVENISIVNCAEVVKKKQFDFWTVDREKFTICYNTVRCNVNEKISTLPADVQRSNWLFAEENQSSIDNFAILLYWGGQGDKYTHDKIIKHFVSEQLSELKKLKEPTDLFNAFCSLRNGMGVYEAFYLINTQKELKDTWEKLLEELDDLGFYLGSSVQDVTAYNEHRHNFTNTLLNAIMKNITEYYEKYTNNEKDRKRLIDVHLLYKNQLMHDLDIYLNQFGALSGAIIPIDNSKKSIATKKSEYKNNEFNVIYSSIDTINGRIEKLKNKKGHLDKIIDQQLLKEEITNNFCVSFRKIFTYNLKDKISRSIDKEHIAYLTDRLLTLSDDLQPLNSARLCYKSDAEKVRKFWFNTFPEMIKNSFCGRDPVMSDRFIRDAYYVITLSGGFWKSSQQSKLKKYIRCDAVQAYLLWKIENLVSIFEDEDCQENWIEKLEKDFNFQNDDYSSLDKRTFDDVDKFIETQKPVIENEQKKQKIKKKHLETVHTECEKLADNLNIKDHELLVKVFHRIGNIIAGVGKEFLELEKDLGFGYIIGQVANYLSKNFSDIASKYNKSGKITSNTVLVFLSEILDDTQSNVLSTDDLSSNLENKAKRYDTSWYLVNLFKGSSGIEIKSQTLKQDFCQYLLKNRKEYGNPFEDDPEINTLSKKFKDDSELIEFIKKQKPEDEILALSEEVAHLTDKCFKIHNPMNYGDCKEVPSKYIETFYNKKYPDVAFDLKQFDVIWEDTRAFFISTLSSLPEQAKTAYKQKYKKNKRFNYAKIFYSLVEEVDSFYNASINGNKHTAKPKTRNELISRVIDRAVRYENEGKFKGWKRY